MSRHRSVRLGERTETRLERFAKSKGISISAAHRMALERGLTLYERDDEPPAMQRRKVLSRGVG